MCESLGNFSMHFSPFARQQCCRRGYSVGKLYLTVKPKGAINMTVSWDYVGLSQKHIGPPPSRGDSPSNLRIIESYLEHIW